jgi:hypothetical protein
VNAPSRNKDFIDPVKEALAAKALRESLISLYADDADEVTLADAVEGETGLTELIDELILRRTAALAMAEGVATAIDTLGHRKERFEKRAETMGALIEQALTIAEIPAMERPAATLSIVRRAPKLVVTEEADIPSTYFVATDPKLDKKALTEALKARQAAIDAKAEVIPPAIPGATLSNGSQTLTIRMK